MLKFDKNVFIPSIFHPNGNESSRFNFHNLLFELKLLTTQKSYTKIRIQTMHTLFTRIRLNGRLVVLLLFWLLCRVIDENFVAK